MFCVSRCCCFLSICGFYVDIYRIVVFVVAVFWGSFVIIVVMSLFVLIMCLMSRLSGSVDDGC